MNKMKYLPILAALVLEVAGCATKTVTSGHEFDAAKIANIQRGVTTGEELTAWLGKPLAKTVQPDGTVLWHYFWKKGKVTTTQGSDGPVATSSGERKTLDATVRNGVVENYTYQNDPYWNERLVDAQQ